MLQDIGAGRLAHMDEYGIDRQLLLLTAPGVQVVRQRDGTALAREANDRAAASCRAGRIATRRSRPSTRAMSRARSGNSSAP